MIPFGRLKFYVLMIGAILNVKTLRNALNSAVPAIAADPSLAMTGAQQAALLGSFYPVSWK